jgi:hypothetical protein
MDLLTSAQKQLISEAFDHLHDTFGRTVNLYVKEKEVYIDTGNPFYGNTKKPQEGFELTTIKARIKYLKDESAQKSIGENNLDINMPDGNVRLKVDEEGFLLLKSASKIEVDGILCQIGSSPTRVGPFDIKYYTVYLKYI